MNSEAEKMQRKMVQLQRVKGGNRKKLSVIFSTGKKLFFSFSYMCCNCVVVVFVPPTLCYYVATFQRALPCLYILCQLAHRPALTVKNSRIPPFSFLASASWHLWLTRHLKDTLHTKNVPNFAV